MQKYKRSVYNSTFSPQAQLDFHGLGTLYPYDVEKLLQEFIEDSYHSGFKYVLVITGKGQVVKPTVARFLPKLDLVEDFKLAGYYTGQGGAFEITLKSAMY